MVGSQKGGNFSHPDNEGYPGFILSQVEEKALAAMPIYKPTVVTLLAGTNDMIRNIDVAAAPDRLSKIVGDVVEFPGDRLVVVASTLQLEAPKL
jgi:hypothetical protein